jgi:acyl-coenzyme A synthetase/AMP-(fatty) acid ligase
MITIKKTWSFIKNYWYIPLVVIVSSIGYLLTKGRKIPTDEILKASKKTHEVEKAAIEHAAEQKVKAKQKVQEEYESAVKAIAHVKKTEVKNLEEKSKKEIKEIVKKHYNDPDSLSKDISDLFGIKYVPKDRNNSD